MALNTFNPSVKPSPGTNRKPAVKIKTAEFGDGYTQEFRDGLNHIRLTVTLKWDGLLETQGKEFDDFFRAQGGDTPFYYTLIQDVQRKWVCRDWGWTNQTPNTFTATFVESFALVS